MSKRLKLQKQVPSWCSLQLAQRISGTRKSISWLVTVYIKMYPPFVLPHCEVCSGSDRDCFVDQTVLHRLSGCTDFLSVCVFLLLY